MTNIYLGNWGCPTCGTEITPAQACLIRVALASLVTGTPVPINDDERKEARHLIETIKKALKEAEEI